ncbi:MAG: plastocyanin/azurin family copper-binding protein [Candidatus Altiarchaeota archaeon]
MKGKTYGILAIVLLAVVGLVLLRGYSPEDASKEDAMTGKDESGMTQKDDETMMQNDGDAKAFSLSGVNFKFLMDGVENPEIRVKRGDRVRIEFTSTQGLHDWVVDEFNARTERLQAPGSASIEFTADKTGTFEYYCSVGQHRQMGMKGNLVVEMK